MAEIYRSILTLSCIAPIHKCSVSAEAADMVSRLLVLQPHHRYELSQSTNIVSALT